MSEIQAIVYGAFMGIIGTIAGSIITSIGAIKAIKISEFNKGASTFHAAFVGVIFFLRQDTKDGQELICKIITSDVLIEQEKAKILFEPFLHESILVGLNKAWEEYAECRYNYSHSKTKSSEEDRKDHSQYCLTHIYSLLKYAEFRK